MLATVLFTDIVGSTERAVELGDRRWRELLSTHDAAVRRELERFRGREVDTAGDGFLAAFDGPARAVRCALSAGDAVRQLGVEIRAGIHTGECELDGPKIRGIAVHTGRADRLARRPGRGARLADGQGSRRRLRPRVRRSRRARAQGRAGRVAGLRRRLNLGDEHPVVGRRRVREHVRSSGLADSALENKELPERVGLRRLDELGEGQEVEAVRVEDLL